MVEHGAVLLVEDDEDNRGALEELVWLAGLDVVAVGTGAEAFAHLRREPGRWCLVMVDWWLPDMTGEHFRRRQRLDPRIADIAIAVLTGDARAKEAAERAGCAHFLLKPIDPDIVTEMVRSHCRGLRMTSTSDECGCAALPSARRRSAKRAGGTTAVRPYAQIWKSILIAQERVADSRQVQQRARGLRELAQSVCGRRFRGRKMSVSSETTPMPWMLPDRPASLEASAAG